MPLKLGLPDGAEQPVLPTREPDDDVENLTL